MQTLETSIERLAARRIGCGMRKPVSIKRCRAANEASARVLVVDPSPVMRVGVTHLLHGLSAHRVVGCCDGEEEALRYIRAVPVDVVLTEVVLGQGTGLGLLRTLLDEKNHASVVFFSALDDFFFGLPIARAGGRGYINKSQTGPEIVQALSRVVSGELVFTDSVRQQMLTLQRGNAMRNRNLLPGGLSAREFDVFQLMGKGFATEEIARHLGISPKTVGLHRFNINHKLGCRCAAELYRAAVLWSEAVLLRDGTDVLARSFLQADVGISEMLPPLADQPLVGG